jgi:hypothetical protein
VHDRSAAPRARFRRAIERTNLLGAETSAREMGVVDLGEALDLVVLVAEVDPEKLDGYARRFLARLADERRLRLAEVDLAVIALRALPSPRARDALRACSSMTSVLRIPGTDDRSR